LAIVFCISAAGPAGVTGGATEALALDDRGSASGVLSGMGLRAVALPTRGEDSLEEQETDTDTEEDQRPIAVLNGQALSVAGVPVYVNGILTLDGIIYRETTYVSVEDFCREIYPDAEVSWDEETRQAGIECEGLSAVLYAEQLRIAANGRSLYMPYGLVVMGGEVMAPVRELAKLFGAEVVWNEEVHSVDIVTDEVTFIADGDDFYDSTDLYWLSRLIDSEARNQEMDGKIAVGNVVLNRVALASMPDSIYDVIFDTKYGVQFSVIQDGSIYLEPSEDAVLAAKFCLEGYERAGDSLYFVNPSIGSTAWFRSTRTFVTAIGDHEFYA